MSKYQHSKYEFANIILSLLLRKGYAMHYRQRIRNIREDRDFTQADIAELLNKSQQGYQHIEAGRAELKIEDLVKLCRHYGVSADYMIGLIDDPKPYKNN